MRGGTRGDAICFRHVVLLIMQLPAFTFDFFPAFQKCYLLSVIRIREGLWITEKQIPQQKLAWPYVEGMFCVESIFGWQVLSVRAVTFVTCSLQAFLKALF